MEDERTADLQIGKPETSAEPKGWYSRGYLPHLDAWQVNQFVTFRLHDSVPIHMIEQWQEELKFLPEDQRRIQLIRMIEKYLDVGHGNPWLAKSAISELVESSLKHWDNARYKLHAYVVMPNHVHALLRPFEGCHLFEIVQSWKKFTARRANVLLGRRGAFWFRDYFDRFIRDELHFGRTATYIEMNPVNAGLCAKARDWEFSSARDRLRTGQSKGDADLEIGGPGRGPS